MWLRDYLPSSLRERGCEVRTLTFGYDTVLGDNKPAPSIRGIAGILLESLRLARTEEKVCAPEPLCCRPRLTHDDRNGTVR